MKKRIIAALLMVFAFSLSSQSRAQSHCATTLLGDFHGDAQAASIHSGIDGLNAKLKDAPVLSAEKFEAASGEFVTQAQSVRDEILRPLSGATPEAVQQYNSAVIKASAVTARKKGLLGVLPGAKTAPLVKPEQILELLVLELGLTKFSDAALEMAAVADLPKKEKRSLKKNGLAELAKVESKEQLEAVQFLLSKELQARIASSKNQLWFFALASQIRSADQLRAFKTAVVNLHSSLVSYSILISSSYQAEAFDIFATSHNRWLRSNEWGAGFKYFSVIVPAVTSSEHVKLLREAVQAGIFDLSYYAMKLDVDPALVK
jgi:hypothetical protein